MKKKQFQEFKTKPVSELQKDLKSFAERLQKMKFDLVAGKVKNIREIKETKKMIARILTLIKQKQHGK